LHWPKVLDVSDDGTIYVTNGSDQDEKCTGTRPFRGGILKLDATNTGGVQVAKGFRNPIAIRCPPGHNLCWAVELSLDYSGDEGGREKVVPVRQGDDWGYPCCATTNLPFPGISPTPDCSMITPETNSFVIGETPFGIDFEVPRHWPAPYAGTAIITQ